jgi:predicted nucleic acid binding AN1-type Zn finger protein
MSARCATCNKKTGIMPFDCKCGLQYCAKHRHPEEHSCTYDFKTEERNKLSDTLTSKNVSTKRLNMNQNSSSGGGGNCAC